MSSFSSAAAQCQFTSIQGSSAIQSGPFFNAWKLLAFRENSIMRRSSNAGFQMSRRSSFGSRGKEWKV